MRKVTEKAAQAFANGQTMASGNTKVMGGDSNFIVTLYGNVIATREGSKVILTDSGWRTATTKERLNGILSTLFTEKYRYGIVTHNKEWIINTYERQSDGSYLVMTSRLWHGSMEFNLL